MNNKKEKKDQKQYLIVNCAECSATVRAEVLALHTIDYFDTNACMTLPVRQIAFVLCPNAHPILAQMIWQGEDTDGISIWSGATRLWPQPERDANKLIPEEVRVSLAEANKCHQASAYTASAVMCGRALEGICNQFQTNDRYLGKGLKELLDKDIIDQRLFDWSEQLRRHRNMAAHATGKEISKEDATDLLDFLNAICDYVFILTPKFKAFMERQNRRPNPQEKKDNSESNN